MPIRRFGHIKDRYRPDALIHKPLKVGVIPSSYSLAQYCPPVRDQGNLGSCVGFGISENLSGTAKQANAFVEVFSPTWVYNGARLIEGTLSSDSGAEPSDALDFLVKNGCLLEHFRPYKDTLDTTDPTTWGFGADAAQWPLLTYVRVTDGAPNICDAIAQGHLVSIGAPWFDSWMNPGTDGVLGTDYSSVAGGHETLLFGYDQAARVFYGQNSWGTSWGLSGTYVMPFSAVQAFLGNGGYDAHYVTVNWGSTPTPAPPTPTPTPTPPTPTPVPPTPTPTPSPCAVKLMYRILTGQKQLKVEETTNSGKTWVQIGPIISIK